MHGNRCVVWSIMVVLCRLLVLLRFFLGGAMELASLRRLVWSLLVTSGLLATCVLCFFFRVVRVVGVVNRLL